MDVIRARVIADPTNEYTTHHSKTSNLAGTTPHQTPNPHLWASTTKPGRLHSTTKAPINTPINVKPTPTNPPIPACTIPVPTPIPRAAFDVSPDPAAVALPPGEVAVELPLLAEVAVELPFPLPEEEGNAVIENEIEVEGEAMAQN